MKNVRSLLVIVAAGLAGAVPVACSGSDPTPAAKTDGGVDASRDARVPATKTTATASAKPTATPTTKPTTTTSAPPTAPPEMPPKTPDLVDPTQLDSESAFTIDEASCAKAGLTDGKGYCLPDTSYLVGCVGGKLKALDCSIFNSADFAADCLDEPKAGCFGVTLSPVAADVLDDAPVYGSDSGETCPSEQEGKGYCDGALVAMCSGGKVFAIDCGTYGTAGATCKPNSSGSLSCF